MAVTTADVFVTSLVALFSVLFWAHKRHGRRPPYPPGPPGLPLLGNLFDIPKTPTPWDTYVDWSRQYKSDIVRISVLGTNIVIANTLEVVTELLDKRSTMYSDRPRMVMLNELCNFGWGLAFLPYGDAWRDCRRIIHQQFHVGPVKQFRPHEQRSTNNFLVNLHRQPEKLMDNLRHMAASAIMSIAYDIDVQSLDDSYIHTAEVAGESISETTNAGSYLVDILPILKYVPEWFPGAGFQQQAKYWRAAVERLRDAPYEDVQRRLAAETLNDCAAKAMIESYSKKSDADAQYIDYLIRSTLGSLYIGGADTTVSSLASFFLAMTLYPEIQKKARKELDEVLGTHRFPEFDDQPQLPYIEAILRETVRWNPVVPLDVPHMLTEEDIYQGYYLPKGSLVIANTWAILHDEMMYPDPNTFNPDRFLHPDGTLNPDVRDPAVAAFGFGRRICPGRYLALDSMWITIARVLALFEIKRAVGEDGKEIVPDGEYFPGFLYHPKPFPCIIKPRSREHEVLIQELANH